MGGTESDTMAGESDAPEQPLTLDERVARGRSQHTCLRRLDELMFCLTPTNQFAKYYNEGTYDYCPARFRAWQLCLKTKLSKPERAQELQLNEWAKAVPGTHLWAFRPAYEAEAYERYGIKPAEANAHPQSEGSELPV